MNVRWPPINYEISLTKNVRSLLLTIVYFKKIRESVSGTRRPPLIQPMKKPDKCTLNKTPYPVKYLPDNIL
jgi:hypothetical protein